MRQQKAELESSPAFKLFRAAASAPALQQPRAGLLKGKSGDEVGQVNPLPTFM
jgi:hypothetical protein